MQIKGAATGGVILQFKTARGKEMDGIAYLISFFDAPGWVMVLGGTFGIFCVVLFANLHRSSADLTPPRQSERERRD